MEYFVPQAAPHVARAFATGRQCAECSTPVEGSSARCAPCAIERKRALQRAANARYYATDKGRTVKRKLQAGWQRRNRDKQNGYNRA